MKPITWRDEKLYKLQAEDYFTAFQRALGTALSAIKGLGMAGAFVLFS